MMSKPMLGLALGGVLGLIDGLSALFYPDAASMIVAIVIGSTIKGLVTGFALGLLARRVRSNAAGVLVGPGLGLALSYVAAMTPDPQGRHHYLEIMLPGAVLGVIVGFATQRFGSSSAPARTKSVANVVVLVLSFSHPVMSQSPQP